ncbi:MAG: SET domain-containing protein-lysine N-methyltransferase [Thermoanaerobaculia bacterium]
MSASSKPLRICLLTNQDLNDLPDDDWPCDPRPFMPEAEWELVVLDKTTAVAQVIAQGQRGFDVFFNLCDGAWDEEDNPGIEVVETLERLEVPFTGADSGFFEPSREAMKRVCHALEIDTPAYVIAKRVADVRRAARDLTFPLFVKHPASYASVGLTRESKVEDEKALLKQARIMIKAYGGALIEEFIDGLECTVLVAENPEDPDRPIVYQPIQYRFPEGDSFKHSDLKWVVYEDLETASVEDENLDKLLRDVSARFFVGINGASYGRCDLRVDSEGRAFMLEINPNCGLYYPPADASSADFCLQADPQGHEGFTRLIVETAIKRHARRARRWAVGHNGDGSYGVFSTRPIPRGQRIVPFEGQPRRLVSLSHVEETWDRPQRDFFHRTAWPVSDDVFAAWSEDPGEWKPIRHSCDPNAWLDGLDVVARRRIKVGEEITLDFATIHNEVMPSFECRCGAEACRGRIRGRDHLEDFVDRYGVHISPYVRQKRAVLNGVEGED